MVTYDGRSGDFDSGENFAKVTSSRAADEVAGLGTMDVAIS